MEIILNNFYGFLKQRFLLYPSDRLLRSEGNKQEFFQ